MSRDQELADLALDILESWHGRPYKWGGDDPSGIDCSGLVIEVLKSVGLFDRGGDATAEGLRRLYRRSPATEATARPGCLVFWMNADGDRAVHVEMVVERIGGRLFAMGASGGGRHTKTPEDAARHNAYVKIRPVDTRPGQKVFVDPFDLPVDDGGGNGTV